METTITCSRNWRGHVELTKSAESCTTEIAVSILVFSITKKAQWKNKKFTFLFHSAHVQVLSAWETNTEEHFLKKASAENLLYAISHNHNAAQTGAKLKSQRQLHSLLNHMLIVFF